VPMFHPSSRTQLAAAYAEVAQPSKGMVFGFVENAVGQGVAGVTVAISPAPPGGTHYFGLSDYNPALTTTTSAGAFIAFNVTPGPITFTATKGTAQFFVLDSVAGPNGVSVM